MYSRRLSGTSAKTSPSLRGSGLKCYQRAFAQAATASPSLRGSGLKCEVNLVILLEMLRLPLYEGVD